MGQVTDAEQTDDDGEESGKPLGSSGDTAPLSVIADQRAHSREGEKPSLEAGGSSGRRSRPLREKRGGGKDRKKRPKNSQTGQEKPKTKVSRFHG